MGPCIIMLKHEMMATKEWYDNRPHDLITVSLYIQIAINKMQLCSLSIAYVCPYDNPVANWPEPFTADTEPRQSIMTGLPT
jgi:hypothetical protein